MCRLATFISSSGKSQLSLYACSSNVMSSLWRHGEALNAFFKV